MQNPWLFLKEIAAKSIDVNREDIEEPITGYGDLAFPCFSLAKKEKRNPVELAKELENRLNIKFFKKIQAIGPYLNFYVDWERFGNQLLRNINKDYGRDKNNKTAVIDLSSPNPAHPFHMGTIRSTLIGESLARILENQGLDVKRICYINDLGKQAATLLFGYQKLANGKEPKGKPDVWLGNIYFDVSKEIGENKELEDQVFDTIKRYEKGEKEVRKLGDILFKKWCLKGFEENWKNLGINFDKIIWESELIKKGEEMVEELRKKNLTFESEGATILKLEPDLPNTVLVRKDGTGLYLTRDLPLTIWKFEKFKPDINIFSVAEDQKLHFQQQFKTLDLLGYHEFSEKSIHLWYSMVLLEGKKMSARKGWMVLWDELLEEGYKKALQEVKKRWPEVSKKEKERRAKDIALGAIIYLIVKYAPEKIINFSWEQALRFEGDTGPYLQYTYARANSILKKGKVKNIRKFDSSFLKDEREISILKILAQYPNILARSSRDLRPHCLANYLFNLAENFNNFYQNIPVLKSEKGFKEARLKLVECVKTILRNGLDLLSMPVIEKM